MKRNCNEIDTTDEDMVTGKSENNSPTPKKIKDKGPPQASDFWMTDFKEAQMTDFKEDQSSSEQLLMNMFTKYVGSVQHSFVERADNSLVNPDYVGLKTYHEQMELDAHTSNASQFVLANMGNKVDQIGLQMKHLNECLKKALNDTKRDSLLHMAACNFVKKPGQTYHLYERPSGQTYFSMLSPKDWSGNMPHTFLGSWYLESDQTWTLAEKRHLRFEGVSFMHNLM